ncbi:hypothetical protein DN601_29825, partial [Klebsiella quasipneumoniae subsp. similipneumoniae]
TWVQANCQVHRWFPSVMEALQMQFYTRLQRCSELKGMIPMTILRRFSLLQTGCAQAQTAI